MNCYSFNTFALTAFCTNANLAKLSPIFNGCHSAGRKSTRYFAKKSTSTAVSTDKKTTVGHCNDITSRGKFFHFVDFNRN